MTTPTSTEASAVHAGERPRTLDDLAELDATELDALYRACTTPRVTDLHGDLDGRMLASPHAGRALGAAMRTLARSRLFPWRGKSFAPQGEDRGEGRNRVLSGSIRWFRFETSIGRSRAGDFDALQLDYDLRDNPFFLRGVRDELRTVEPGLHLGQAYVPIRGRHELALYFALQRPR